VGGQVLLVPNFTLLGDCRKGRRPSFTQAGSPEMAEQLFEDLVAFATGAGVHAERGAFGARMAVSLVNDGPVTLLLDSRREF
jgi:D-tyrosyl-tRNA(Tyr) deacylase